MKALRSSIIISGLLGCMAVLGAGSVAAQARRPAPGKGGARPGAKVVPKAPPAPIEAAKRVENTMDDDKPPLVITKVKINNPVLVFYQQPAPGTVVQQLLMDEKNLPLLKSESIEKLVERREVFLDGLGNYAPPGADAERYRLTGVSLLARTEKRKTAPDGRSTYAKLRVPEVYIVRESAEEYRHFVSGPQKQGSRIDFSVNGLPGVDSVRAAYTLRKIDASERGAGTGDIIR